jgi:hypothetical protein
LRILARGSRSGENDSTASVLTLEAGDIALAFARLDGILGHTIQSWPMAQERSAVVLAKGYRVIESAEVPKVLRCRERHESITAGTAI